MDIVKHLSKEKVLEFIGDNELLRDLYNSGPVYRASIDDFVVNIIERSIKALQEEYIPDEMIINDTHKDYLEGMNSGVVECIVAFRNQFFDLDDDGIPIEQKYDL